MYVISNTFRHLEYFLIPQSILFQISHFEGGKNRNDTFFELN